MKIISVTNQKGGVGKTTTAINLAAGLGRSNKRVLVIDLDPQANATTALGVERYDIKYSVFDLLTNDKKIADCRMKTSAKGVDIVPSSVQLAGADIFLSKIGKDTENLLKNKFQEVKKEYDYIIIDCPPSLGLLNRNALSSSNSVIIPMQPDFFSLEGITQLLSTISLVKKKYNPRLKIEGIVLTMYDGRTNLAVEVKQEIRKFFKEKVYKTSIPRNIKLAESPSQGKSIFDYDPSCAGAKAYQKLTKELINGK